ncbi:MAG TPA: hypothetical protein V6C72_02105 [Chroococcales cyanobacterium]
MDQLFYVINRAVDFRLSEADLLKDWHWIFVFAAILITPFLPAILRDKCPACKRRKLQSIETLKLLGEEGSSSYNYVTFYRCDRCSEYFKRNKSGPLKPSSNDEFKLMSQAAIKKETQV